MLFQLMVPHDFKDAARQLDRVVLVVDSYTANLPWELMLADDPSRAGRRQAPAGAAHRGRAPAVVDALPAPGAPGHRAHGAGGRQPVGRGLRGRVPRPERRARRKPPPAAAGRRRPRPRRSSPCSTGWATACRAGHRRRAARPATCSRRCTASPTASCTSRRTACSTCAIATAAAAAAWCCPTGCSSPPPRSRRWRPCPSWCS